MRNDYSEGTHPLRHTLCDNGNGLDLGVLHELHGRRVDGPRRGKVDDRVDVRVLGDGLFRRLVDGEQSLAGAPVPAGVSVVWRLG